MSGKCLETAILHINHQIGCSIDVPVRTKETKTKNTSTKKTTCPRLRKNFKSTNLPKQQTLMKYFKNTAKPRTPISKVATPSEAFKLQNLCSPDLFTPEYQTPGPPTDLYDFGSGTTDTFLLSNVAHETTNVINTKSPPLVTTPIQSKIDRFLSNGPNSTVNFVRARDICDATPENKLEPKTNGFIDAHFFGIGKNSNKSVPPFSNFIFKSQKIVVDFENNDDSDFSATEFHSEKPSDEAFFAIDTGLHENHYESQPDSQPDIKPNSQTGHFNSQFDRQLDHQANRLPFDFEEYKFSPAPQLKHEKNVQEAHSPLPKRKKTIIDELMGKGVEK